jgi:hypothetical protein
MIIFFTKVSKIYEIFPNFVCNFFKIPRDEPEKHVLWCVNSIFCN